MDRSTAEFARAVIIENKRGPVSNMSRGVGNIKVGVSITRFVQSDYRQQA
jgi:hypothetical protein